MKIGFTGLDLPEGKIKIKSDRMDALIEKDRPKKVSPFYVELVRDDFSHAQAIVVHEDSILDVLIEDLEKCEGRLERSDDEAEIALMKKCIEYLENETPLCDVELTEPEQAQIRALELLSFKPVLKVQDSTDDDTIIRQALEKAGVIFFFTSGPKEVHAWPVTLGSDIITCAGKIHTDLAKGFIKGDVVHFDDYLQCHNFNDGRKKGLVKVVDRDHLVQDGDVIEIRFNV